MDRSSLGAGWSMKLCSNWTLKDTQRNTKGHPKEGEAHLAFFFLFLYIPFLLSLICYYDTHIIDNSYVILCHFLYPTTLYPYNSLGVASMFLLSLSAICSLYHRYLSGHLPNIYRTNTGHLPDIYRTRIEGTPLLYAYYIEAASKIDISSSIVLHKTEHTSRMSDTSEAPNGSLSNYLFRVYIERIRTLCNIIQ